jgi:C-terminal processing protease CtpA/Prc
VVSGLVPESPAGKAGLAIGQVVAAVDGESVEGFSIDDFCRIFAMDHHENLTTVDGGTFSIGPVKGFYPLGPS